jgi:hypothetical protein
MATVIAGINEAFVTGDDAALDMARVVLDTVLDHAIVAPIAETPFSLRGGWLARWGEDASTPALLVPHRFGRHGWFDYGPMPLELPLWLWWWSRRDDDLARLRRAIEGLPAMAERVKPFRDKAEAGHEAPWLAFLDGDLPDYPERALEMALGQVARRVALMQGAPTDPDAAHLHFWQRVNPVVTEVLSQLVSGTPQVLYNGGLPFAAVVYEDADASRPGLPPDVAALVSRLDGDDLDLALVNTSTTRARRVVVRASRFGERARAFDERPGDPHPMQFRACGRRRHAFQFAQGLRVGPAVRVAADRQLEVRPRERRGEIRHGALLRDGQTGEEWMPHPGAGA